MGHEIARLVDHRSPVKSADMDQCKAAGDTQAIFQTATQPSDDLEPLATEGVKLREMLLAEAKALALRSLVDKHKLDNLKGATSRMNIAQDLQALSTVLLDSWAKIQGKTPTTQEDLLTASRIGTRLTRLVGARDQGPAVVAEATDRRLRVFTLMLRTYEEARAAIGYLRRREEDAESIAPTLYPGKGKRRSNEPELASPPATQPATSSAPVSADTTQQLPAITPAQIAAANAAAAQKGAPASKDPFLA